MGVYSQLPTVGGNEPASRVVAGSEAQKVPETRRVGREERLRQGPLHEGN
jgi:hypothetical protein